MVYGISLIQREMLEVNLTTYTMQSMRNMQSKRFRYFTKKLTSVQGFNSRLFNCFCQLQSLV